MGLSYVAFTILQLDVQSLVDHSEERSKALKAGLSEVTQEAGVVAGQSLSSPWAVPGQSLGEEKLCFNKLNDRTLRCQELATATIFALCFRYSSHLVGSPRSSFIISWDDICIASESAL